MSGLQPNAHKGRADEATHKADVLSLKLYHLTEIVKLAAFSAEARRTLKGIDDATFWRSEMKGFIEDAVSASNNWLELDDATSNVLAYVAGQLEEVNVDFTQNLYDLAAVKAGGTKAKKNGGAA